MKVRQFLVVLCFFLGTVLLFFYPSFFYGYLPFPGDLLVGHYAPWNSYSFLGYAPGGVPHKAQGIDVVRQLFPWKHFSIEMIKKGELPFWNPYNFAGNPHLANYQSSVFYPLNLVFFFFSFSTAWTIFIVLQPFLACLFTYLFLRELKVGRLGAMLAGITFAYSLYFTVWLEWGNIGHAILWFPLCLFLVEKIIQKGYMKWFLLFAFSLTASFLAGYVQVTIYLTGVVCLFFFYGLIREIKKIKEIRGKIFLFFGSVVLALALSFPQFLPTLELFRYSARQAYSFERMVGLLSPWFYPITTFASDFFGSPASRNYWYPGTYIERVTYIGVLPLFFAFWAIFSRRRHKKSIFFVVLALVVLLLTVNLFPARLFYRWQIPGLSTGVPTRILFLFAFPMAVLAGMGFDSWLKNKDKKKTLKPILIFGSVYLFLWLFTFLAPKFFPSAWWALHLGVSRRNLILPTGIVAAFGGLTIVNWLVRRLSSPSRRTTRSSIIPVWRSESVNTVCSKSKGQQSSWLVGHLEGVVKRLLPGGAVEVVTLSVILLLTLFDLFFYFRKITPFSPPEFVYPETEIMEFFRENAGINRFWGYGSGYIESNFSTLTRTFSVDGYDPLFIRRYGELISASDDGQIKDSIPRSDVGIVGGFGQEAMRQNPYRQRLLDLLGVKYVLQKDKSLSEEWRPDYQTFPEEIYELIWQKGPWQVYENKAVLPRTFLVYDFEVIKEDQAIIDRIFSEDFDLSKTVILEEDLKTPRGWADALPRGGEDRKTPRMVSTTARRDSSEVDISNYSPNKINLTVETEQPGLLFLSDNYYPNWKAQIDGQPTEIYRANYSFRAVFVPEGRNQVVFYYKPDWFPLSHIQFRSRSGIPYTKLEMPRSQITTKSRISTILS